MSKKEPLYPHVSKRREPLFPHVPKAEVGMQEWRYIPTVKYTELDEGMMLVDQAGDRWLIKAIDKTGVPAKWAYSLENPATGQEWRRSFTEVERYLKMEQPPAVEAVPAVPVMPEVTESVGNLEKGAWVQFKPEGIMYQITEIGKTRATLVDGEGNITTIPLRQAVYPLEAKPPVVEAVPELYETTKGFEEDVALRKDLEEVQGYKLDAVFEKPSDALNRGTTLQEQGLDIRYVKHVSTPETGAKETWEVYAKLPAAEPTVKP